MLIVESKPSGSSRAKRNKNLRDAWTQVREQAGILFARREDQQYVGVIVTVGVSWFFDILYRKDACYREEENQDYTPEENDTTPSAVKALQYIILSGPYQPPSANYKDPCDRPLLEFGTVESDKELMIIRKKLLRMFPAPRRSRHSRH